MVVQPYLCVCIVIHLYIVDGSSFCVGKELDCQNDIIQEYGSASLFLRREEVVIASQPITNLVRNPT